MSNCRACNNLNIAQDLEALDKELTCIGTSHVERIQIYKILAAILHLGNIEIEETNSGESQISETSRIHLKHMSNLLNIEQQIIEKSLITRSIDINGQIT